ncbi:MULTISPECIES: hypothetical protein [Pseudomonas]|uniref:hypothetical protein n=1 Tax=Pseudomonas TaxID=286 RepID=UPI001B339E4E|nr:MULTISPECIES: hypothetical protein [Pseudomonas]MBP5946206.1 hypothetical protein [Pseudomonas sp. P9(2020)]MBP5957778.1 hypothetical protein [Pseudomonas anatoliensis]MBZ9564345.1 hypothetical protein [Pseudomonas sp. P116]
MKKPPLGAAFLWVTSAKGLTAIIPAEKRFNSQNIATYPLRFCAPVQPKLQHPARGDFLRITAIHHSALTL